MGDKSRLENAIAALGQAPDLERAAAMRQLDTDMASLMPQLLAWIDRTILERWLVLRDQNGAECARLRVGNHRLYQLGGRARAGLMASANETLAEGTADAQSPNIQEVKDWISAAIKQASHLSLDVETNTDAAPHSVGIPCATLAQAWGQNVPGAVSFEGPEDPIGALLQDALVQRQLWVQFEGDVVVAQSDRRGAAELAAVEPAARHALLAVNRAPGLSVIGQNTAKGVSVVAAFSNQKHLVMLVRNADLAGLLQAWHQVMAAP